MTATIYESDKFHHSRDQYYAEVSGYTLLRMTYGQTGGAIKTATASDDSGAPVPMDLDAMVSAMKLAVRRLGGNDSAVAVKFDGSDRVFGEIALSGSRDVLIATFKMLAEAMGDHLDLETCPHSSYHSNVGGYDDLRGLYNDICHTDGEPVYLSDGVYLSADGTLFE